MEIECGHCGGKLTVSSAMRMKRMRCPHCGIIFVVTDREFLEVCPKCGSYSKQDVTFCGKCGSPMVGDGGGDGGGRGVFARVVYGIGAVVMIGLIFNCVYRFNGCVDAFSNIVTGGKDETPFHERYVKVKCPICKSEMLHHWKNSEGEKIRHQMPGCEYCLHCRSYFQIPEKYR